jgi:hypothetical protein
MASADKKRAIAGPTVGEKRQEEVAPEKHGNDKPKIIKPPEWQKMCCGRCGLLLGYIMDNPWHQRHFSNECVPCHKKREQRS